MGGGARMVAAVVLCAASAWMGVAAAREAPLQGLSGDASWAMARVMRYNDHGGRPFAIVDKKQARIHVFDANGTRVASSVVLLGTTPGDHTVPGVGLRTQQGRVAADERTTPAGRFEAMPGVNLKGEHVVWADYKEAFAIHRLRPGAGHATRKAKLASSTPADNRASLGCVVVPVEFYTEVVMRVLGRSPSVVYVLPETRPVSDLFIEG